jgi:SAM-dependent methyltransferase
VADRPAADVERHERETREWLNARFALRPGAAYLTHQPVYGFTPYYLAHFRLAYGLMRRVRELRFRSFIDIGGAEGYTPNLVKQLYGPAFPAFNLDISSSVIRTARQFYSLEGGVVAGIGRLPFPDKSIDLVLCNNVIEHVPEPGKALAELTRVAGKYLVVATDEVALEGHEGDFRADYEHPHGHIHTFTRRGLRDLLGPGTLVETFRSTVAGSVRSALLGPETEAGQGQYGVSRWRRPFLRRRVAYDLLLDQCLAAAFPDRTMSLVAIKDCGGGWLPKAGRKMPVDWGLVEAMWSRGSVDKRVFGYLGRGFVFARTEGDS